MNRSIPTSANNGYADTTAQAVIQAGHEMQEAAVEGARKASNAAMTEAARIGDLAREWLQRQAQSAQSAATAVRDQAAAANDRTQRYVRDEPVKAVLIAAAAGAVLTGLVLLATRSDRR